MEQDRQLRRKVAAMEAALNERLAAMKSSERELQLKEAALLEANDIARKATAMMHHFRGQAQELERQCATMRAATPGSSPPASTQGVSLAWAYAGLQPLSVAGASDAPMQRATLSPPFAWLGSEESQAPVTPPRAAAAPPLSSSTLGQPPMSLWPSTSFGIDDEHSFADLAVSAANADADAAELSSMEDETEDNDKADIVDTDAAAYYGNEKESRERVSLAWRKKNCSSK